MTHQPSSDHQSTAWFDESFEATEFLFANCGNFTPPLHVHETFAIGVIESGGQLFQLGRSPSLVMPEGTLSAINPGTVHGGWPASERGWQYRMFYPSHALVSSALAEPNRRAAGREWSLGQHVIDDQELYREFVGLYVSSQRRETLLERQTRIAVFLRRLFERHGNFAPDGIRARVAPRTVTLVRDYLHAKAESQVSIADLAQAAGVSGTQVIRAFSAGTGMPPHSYLISLRVERAKALLRAGASLAEAALDVGFSDQSQFTRHFKRLTGMTPGRFAAEVSSRKARN